MKDLLFLFKAILQWYLLCDVFSDNLQPFLLHHFYYLHSHKAYTSYQLNIYWDQNCAKS